jgi:hypothetical protein
MCYATYRPEDGNLYRAYVPPSPALVERTRMIEASMDGERVPQRAWTVFFSAACGAIAWTHYERMFHARMAAAAYLAIHAPARRRPAARSTFRCIAD